MIFELINPSDAYTFHAEDVKVAQAVSLLAGAGAYGLKDENGGSHSLLVAFMGIKEATALLETIFGPFGVFRDEHREEIAAALDSMQIGDIPSRRNFDAAMEAITDPAKRKTFREEAHERNRSSLNDIGTFCWEMAKNLWRNQ